MLKIYVESLDITLEVSEDGTFELPNRLYTTTDLKKIVRVVNKTISTINKESCFD